MSLAAAVSPEGQRFAPRDADHFPSGTRTTGQARAAACPSEGVAAGRAYSFFSSHSRRTASRAAVATTVRRSASVISNSGRSPLHIPMRPNAEVSSGRLLPDRQTLSTALRDRTSPVGRRDGREVGLQAHRPVGRSPIPPTCLTLRLGRRTSAILPCVPLDARLLPRHQAGGADGVRLLLLCPPCFAPCADGTGLVFGWCDALPVSCSLTFWPWPPYVGSAAELSAIPPGPRLQPQDFKPEVEGDYRRGLRPGCAVGRLGFDRVNDPILTWRPPGAAQAHRPRPMRLSTAHFPGRPARWAAGGWDNRSSSGT